METRRDTILIVDDDAEISKLLQDYLERNGYRSIAVADGASMFAMLDREQIDIIILDVMLPGNDGLTLCRDLRTRSDVPVIMLTARGEDTDVLLKILRQGSAIARLRDAGWSSIYVYHGANTFDAAHHAAIARAKSLGHAALLQREALLRQHLAEYAPPLGALRMPHAGGALEIGAA